MKNRETEPIQPVEAAAVQATVVYLTGVVANMVQLQLLLACRPAEICQLRPCDVNREREIWLYKPKRHKTQHRGCSRQITISRDKKNCFFRICVVIPNNIVSNRDSARPIRQTAIESAIARACQKAAIRRWTPNQLRHAKATEVRAKFGLEAAQVYLGHGSANVTEIYAERDTLHLQKRCARNTDNTCVGADLSISFELRSLTLQESQSHGNAFIALEVTGNAVARNRARLLATRVERSLRDRECVQIAVAPW